MANNKQRPADGRRGVKGVTHAPGAVDPEIAQIWKWQDRGDRTVAPQYNGVPAPTKKRGKE